MPTIQPRFRPVNGSVPDFGLVVVALVVVVGVLEVLEGSVPFVGVLDSFDGDVPLAGFGAGVVEDGVEDGVVEGVVEGVGAVWE